MKSGPRLPQLEKDLAQKWTPNTTINKLIKKKKMQTLKKKKKVSLLLFRSIITHQEC